MEIVTVDIGGTHARFALAEVGGGRVTRLGNAVTFETANHASLGTAWEAFERQVGRTLPRAAAMAVACPITGETLKLTNNPWTIRPASLGQALKLDALTLINDFGAVGHAVVQVDPGYLRHLTGPDILLPENGVISIVGPGTGLGVAYVLRCKGHTHVIECEGGHIDFAPLDALEDAILAQLRMRLPRVSVERICSGPGLANIRGALAALEGRTAPPCDDKTLWETALEGSESLATAALERFCLALGAVAGDIALAQGASAVVIAGGLGLRLANMLPQSGFAQRFVAKGRFEHLMSGIPVKLITHPQPGLYGAAAAFAEEYRQ